MYQSVTCFFLFLSFVLHVSECHQFILLICPGLSCRELQSLGSPNGFNPEFLKMVKNCLFLKCFTLICLVLSSVVLPWPALVWPALYFLVFLWMIAIPVKSPYYYLLPLSSSFSSSCSSSFYFYLSFQRFLYFHTFFTTSFFVNTLGTHMTVSGPSSKEGSLVVTLEVRTFMWSMRRTY